MTEAKKVTVIHPSGFPVEVSEARAETLLSRGYARQKRAAKPAEKE